MKSYVFKVIVVGDRQVGKTSLVKRIVHDDFSNTYKATIGADFGVRILTFPNENISVHLQLWDIQGQDRNRMLIRSYYKGAIGAIVVYDISNEESFQAAHLWKQEIDKFVIDEWHRDADSDSEDIDDPLSFPTLLVGNKSDKDRFDALKSIDMKKICEAHDYFSHVEVSARTGKNVETAMYDIVKKIIEERKDEIYGEPVTTDTFQLINPEQSFKQGDGRRCFTSSNERIRLAAPISDGGEVSNQGGFQLYNPVMEPEQKPVIERRCCSG